MWHYYFKIPILICATFITRSVFSAIPNQTIINNQSLDEDFLVNNDLKNIELLWIRKVQGRISRELFTATSITLMSISDSNITDVEDGAFCTNTNLTRLFIYENEIFPNITKGMFENCTNLEFMSLGEVSILEGNFLENVNNLEDLSLNAVNISDTETISAGYFKMAKELEGLKLSGLRPNRYSNDVFSSLPNLKSLTIGNSNKNYNKYAEEESPQLSEDTFSNLNRLQELNLVNVNMTDIKWHRIENLKYLKMIGPFRKGRHFFKNLKNYFPVLEQIALDRRYFTGDEVKFVQRRLDTYNVTLYWLGGV